MIGKVENWILNILPNEELCEFSNDAKAKQDGVLRLYKTFDSCIASAL